MKETLRTFGTAALGAVVACTLMSASPALAGQVEKAAKKITSADIKDGTIKTADLNAQVKGSLSKANSALQDVPDNSVKSGNIVDGSITSGDLGASSVNGNTIANGSVGSADVQDGSISTADLAEGAVTQSKLANSAVGTNQLGDSAVTSAKIAAGAVTQSDLAASSISSSQVQDGSLYLKDIGSSWGQVTLNVPNTGTNSCSVVFHAFEADYPLDDAVILLSSPKTVVGAINLTARPSADVSYYADVVACNTGGSAVDPGPVSLTWAALMPS